MIQFLIKAFIQRLGPKERVSLLKHVEILTWIYIGTVNLDLFGMRNDILKCRKAFWYVRKLAIAKRKVVLAVRKYLSH